MKHVVLNNFTITKLTKCKQFKLVFNYNSWAFTQYFPSKPFTYINLLYSRGSLYYNFRKRGKWKRTNKRRHTNETTNVLHEWGNIHYGNLKGSFLANRGQPSLLQKKTAFRLNYDLNSTHKNIVYHPFTWWFYFCSSLFVYYNSIIFYLHLKSAQYVQRFSYIFIFSRGLELDAIFLIICLFLNNTVFLLRIVDKNVYVTRW